MRFSREVVATFASRVLLVGLGVISSVLTARWLGTSGRGVLATLGALAGIGLQLGNLGLHASNTYLVSCRSELLGGLWGNSTRTAWGVGVAVALATLGAALLFPELLGGIPLPYLAPAAAAIPLQLLTLFGLNLVVGIGRMGLFNALEVTFRTAGVIGLTLILIPLGGGVRDVLLWNLAVAAVGAATLASILGRLIRRAGGEATRADMALFRSSVGYGARAYAAAFLAFMIVRSDMLLVNALRGADEAGIYSIAVQITDLIYLLPMSVGLVLFPRLSRHQGGDPIFAMKVTRHTAFLLLILCLAAGVLARPAISMLYGPGFSRAAFALWWLLPGIWAYGVCNQIATHLASAGMPLSAVVIWIPPLVLNLILNLAWIPRWGIVGAAAASTLCYFLVLVSHLLLWRRRDRVSMAGALLLQPSDLREIGSLAGVSSWS